MEWGDFGVPALVSGIISAVIGILVKHRAELSIVRAQAELEKEAIRHQITYGRLHEKRFEFLTEFYPMILELKRLVGIYINSQGRDVISGEENEDFRNFHAQWIRVFDEYKVGRLLIPDELDRIFESVISGTLFGATGYARNQARLDSLPPDSNFEPLQDIVDKHRGKLQAALDHIETTIRKEAQLLIGVEDPGSQPNPCRPFFCR